MYRKYVTGASYTIREGVSDPDSTKTIAGLSVNDLKYTPEMTRDDFEW